MKKLAVGVIGLGNAGFSHYRWFRMNRHCDVKAVYSLDAEVKKRSWWFRNIHFATTPEELISSVNAISICSPDQTHYSYMRMALEQGKHVLVEKPIVVDKAHLSELDRLAAQRPELKIAVHNQMRVVPTYAKIKRLLEHDPDFSEVFQTVVNYRHNCRNIEGLDWRIQQNQNLLLGAAIHPLDYALWLFDFEQLERIELMENHLSWKEYPSSTNFTIMLQTKSGRLASVNGNCTMVWPFYTDCTVMAEKATIINNLLFRGRRFEFHHNNRVTFAGYSIYPLNAFIWLLNRVIVRMKGCYYPPFTIWEWSRASRTIVDNFVDAVLFGKEILVPYESARRSLAILLDLDEQRRAHLH